MRDNEKILHQRPKELEANKKNHRKGFENEQNNIA